MPASSTVDLLRPATHVAVQAGDEIVLRGSLYSRHDGSVVDAVTTTWPKEAPGGAGVVAGGIFDLEAGGFERVAVDAEEHVVRAVATGDHAPACRAWGVESPCLVLRSGELAHARLLTGAEWLSSLRGAIHVEQRELGVGAAPVEPPEEGSVPSALPGVVALATALAVCFLGWLGYRRWARSDRRRLARLLGQVGRMAARIDPILAQVLRPSLTSTARALRQRRFDPAAAPGRQLTLELERIHAELHAREAQRRLDEERDATDALLGELLRAVDAAAEASRAG